MRIFIVITLIWFVASVGFAQGPACHALFEEVNETSMIEGLAKLRSRLDTAKAEGQSNLVMNRLKQDYQKKEYEVAAYFASHRGLSSEDVKNMVKAQIQKTLTQEKAAHEAARREAERKEAAEKVKSIDGSVGFFHRVEPGTFLMGEVPGKKQVTIDRPFEMMATLTTNKIYRQVALMAYELWPETYKHYKVWSAFVDRDPLRPAVNVSPESAEQWLQALNALSQHPSQSVTMKLEALLFGHRPGAVYRLPTPEQWEFVASNRGAEPGLPEALQTPEGMDQHVWSVMNSGFKHEVFDVATKKPLHLSGADYYDMFGNAFEIMDSPDKKGLYEIRGGSIESGPDRLLTNKPSFILPHIFKNHLGFRLVREVSEP
jgi:formylglycine-generating enzyme required for sulfatase activity